MNANKQSGARLLAVALAAAMVVCAFVVVAADVSAADESGPVTATTADGDVYYYTTVYDALKNTDGDGGSVIVFDTITLTDNVTETNTDRISISQDLTINIGPKVTWDVTSCDGIIINAEGCEVTILGSSGSTIQYAVDADDGGNVEVNNNAIAVIAVTVGSVVLDSLTVSVSVPKGDGDKGEYGTAEEVSDDVTYTYEDGASDTTGTDTSTHGSVVSSTEVKVETQDKTDTNGGIADCTITGVSVSGGDVTFQNVKFNYSYTALVTTVTTQTITTTTVTPYEDGSPTTDSTKIKSTDKTTTASVATTSDNTVVDIAICSNITSSDRANVTFKNSSGSTRLVLEGAKSVDVTMNSLGIPTAITGIYDPSDSSIATVGVNCDVTVGGVTIYNLVNGGTVGEGDDAVTYDGGTVTLVGDVSITDATNTRTVVVGDGETETAVTAHSSFENRGTVTVAACPEDDEDADESAHTTLTVYAGFVNYGDVNVYGDIVIEADGALVNNGTVTICNLEYADEGKTNCRTTGLDHITGYGVVEYELQTEEAVLGGTVKSDLDFSADQKVTVVDDVVIEAGYTVVVEGELRIPSGHTVYVFGTLIVTGPGATIVNDGAIVVFGNVYTTDYVAGGVEFEQGDFAFQVADSATLVNNNLVLLYTPEGDGENSLAMIVCDGGSVTNAGLLQTGEGTVLRLEGTVRNHDTMVIGGAVYTPDTVLDETNEGYIVYNWCTVQLGTDTEVAYLVGELEVQMMKYGATVEVVALANLRPAGEDSDGYDDAAYLDVVVGQDYADQHDAALAPLDSEALKGLVDNGTIVDDGEAYLGVFLPDVWYDGDGELVVTVIRGLTVTSVHNDLGDGSIQTAVLLDGAVTADGVQTQDESIGYNTAKPAVILESGRAAVTGTLTVGDGALLQFYSDYYASGVYVSGEIRSTSDNVEVYLTGGTTARVVTILGDGRITVGQDDDGGYGLDAYVTGAAYDGAETVDGRSVDVRVYTSLRQALADLGTPESATTIHIFGTNALADDETVAANITVELQDSDDSLLYVPYGVTLVFDEGSGVSGSADYTKNGCGISVDGSVIADASVVTVIDKGKVEIRSDVIIDYDDGSRLYTNIYDAIDVAAENGGTVKLAYETVLTQDLVVPAGVTLDLDGNDLYVDGNKLTVDGVIVSNDYGTVHLYEDEDGADVTGSELVVNGCIYGSAIENAEELAKESASGCYTATEKGTTTYHVKPVRDALADLADADTAVDADTVYYPGIGTEEDLTVSGGILVVTGALNASSVTLDGATLDASAGTFNGFVMDADGAVELARYSGTAVSDGDGLVVAGEAVSGIVSGDVSVASDTEMAFTILTVYGTLTVDGELYATTVAVYGGVAGDGYADLTYTCVGDSADAFIGASASIDVDYVDVAAGGYIVAAAGSSVKDYDNLVSTEYYVGDSLWVTVYANPDDLSIGFTTEDEETLVPTITDGMFLYWVDDDGDFAGAIDDDGVRTYANVGDKGYTVVNAYAVYDIYSLTVRADTGIADVYLDGVIMVKSGNGEFTASNLAAGSYKVEYTLTAGYTGSAVLKYLGGDATASGFTITLSGSASAVAETDKAGNVTGYVDECLFQLTGVQAATGAGTSSGDTGGSTSSSDDGISLTDWLLIVLIVLVLIVAIVVAYRLLRSRS